MRHDEGVEVAGESFHFMHNLMAVGRTLKVILGTAAAPGGF